MMTNDPVGEHPEQVPSQSPSGLRAAFAFLNDRRYLVILLGIALFLAIPVVLIVTHPISASSVQPQTQAAGVPALAALEEIVQKSPTVGARVNLAAAYIDHGEPARALPLLLSSIAEEPGNAAAWNDLCVVHTLQKSYAIAVPACEKAVSLAPNLPLARNNLRWAEHERGAVEDALKASDSTPESARDLTFYLNRGTDQLNLGRYDDAIQSWQRVLQSDPRNALATNNIGVAHMFMKQTGEAAIWFQKSLALDPQFQLAKNNLAWARSEQAHPPQQ